MKFLEIQSILDEYSARSRKLQGDNLTLERLWPVLQLLGNPQEKLTVIHVAGTSGKTSTAYYCAALLQSSGFTVGLTVSPHIDSLFERVQVNGRAIEQSEFESSFTEFYACIKNAETTISYFEMLVAYELWYFARRGVDYAVIETGMGGLLDATNVLQRSDKVCVITDIGFDHMHVLGSTLPEIAAQKAGIIHEQSTVFMYVQAPEIMQSIYSRVDEKGAQFYGLDSTELIEGSAVRTLPLYQQRNYFLARQAVSYIAQRDNFALPEHSVNPLIPGRMEEWVLQNGSILVMDGAHNQQKMSTFVKSFQDRYKHRKVPVLLALKKGKEYAAVLNALEPIASEIILTTFLDHAGLPVKAQNPTVMQDYLLRTNEKMVITVEPDSRSALEQLLDAKGGLYIVTGSFYLLSEIRSILRRA